MNIKVIFENSKVGSGFKSGHGLSILIHFSGKKYLFDTGANKKLLHNAFEMQESLTDLDGVIISHGHSDHTGGLRFLPDQNLAIYASQGVKDPHYLKVLSKFIYVGMPKSKLDKKMSIISGKTEVIPNFHLLPLGESKNFTKNLYKKRNEEYFLDDFSDELMLVIEEEDGLIVFTGCSHHGILNMAREALTVFPDKPIKYLIGGFHMIGIPYLNNLGMSKAEVSEIGNKLSLLPIEKILTCHCTGVKAFSILKEQLGDKIESISTGQNIDLI